MGVATAAALTGLAWPRPWQQQSCSSHWERIWSPQHPGGERGKESKVRVPMRILGMGQGNQGNTLRLLYKTSVTPGPHRQASHGLPSSQVTFSEYPKWAYDCIFKNGAAFGMMPWRLSQGRHSRFTSLSAVILHHCGKAQRLQTYDSLELMWHDEEKA